MHDLLHDWPHRWSTYQPPASALGSLLYLWPFWARTTPQIGKGDLHLDDFHRTHPLDLTGVHSRGQFTITSIHAMQGALCVCLMSSWIGPRVLVWFRWSASRQLYDANEQRWFFSIHWHMTHLYSTFVCWVSLPCMGCPIVRTAEYWGQPIELASMIYYSDRKFGIGFSVCNIAIEDGLRKVHCPESSRVNQK